MLTKWKEGIPSYKDTDLLTKNDIYKMAVDYVSEYEEGNIKLFCFSKDYDIRTGVSITGRTGYDVVYIMVRSSLAPEQVKMTEFERHVLIAKSFIYGQSCYFASVSIGSKDEARREKGLALKDDDYYYTYQGLEYVPRANYNQHEILLLQALEELGVGYYIKNADNFKKLIGDDCKVYLEDGTTISGYNNVCKYYDKCFLALKEKGVKTDYFLSRAENDSVVYIEYVSDGSATGTLVYAKVSDEDGLIQELRYDSPLKHKVSFR
jgi:hypothetical protein